MNKLRLDIPVLLPEIPDAKDACVARLIAEIKNRPGVEAAHLTEPAGSGDARLCVHYDPDVISLSRVREILRSTGASITERFGHAVWEVDGITHQRRARSIETRLRELDGLIEAEVTGAGAVRVEFDTSRTSQDEILNLLAQAGVRPRKDALHIEKKSGDGHEHEEAEGHDHAHGSILGLDPEMAFAIASGAMLATGFATEQLAASVPSWLPVTLYIAAYFFGGFFTLREAIDNLRRRRFEIDTLMLVAAAGAAALGAWAEGALLLFLFSLGHPLEHYAMGRAKRAIEALA
ncbi:MAG TPA: hypothetical protein PKY73_18795 [Hyphomonas sp.]|nr:hypothetical protein [Hyphomonas sp.]